MGGHHLVGPWNCKQHPCLAQHGSGCSGYVRFSEGKSETNDSNVNKRPGGTQFPSLGFWSWRLIGDHYISHLMNVLMFWISIALSRFPSSSVVHHYGGSYRPWILSWPCKAAKWGPEGFCKFSRAPRIIDSCCLICWNMFLVFEEGGPPTKLAWMGWKLDLQYPVIN